MSLLRKLRLSDPNNIYPLFFTLIFILILLQYSFNTLEALFYDFSVKLGASSNPVEEIIIITLDEESDQFLGEVYPYTYATHSRFMDKLLSESPSVVGHLVSMDVSVTDEENKFKDRFIDLVQKYRNSGGVFRFGTDKDVVGERVPPGKLATLGYSLALINKDGNQFARDNITRRAILNVSGEDSFHQWISRRWSEKKKLEPKEAAHYRGAYYSREADATFTLFQYASNPNLYSSVTSIPFHRVVVGNFPSNYFKNKVVLIGPQYISNAADYVKTPFGGEQEKASKLNIHAQIISALQNDRTVYAIPDVVSDILATLIAIFLSIYISRVQPAKGLLITMLLMLMIILGSVVFFIIFGVWLKLAHVILSIFVVYYIWVPFRAIGEYQRRYAFEEETRMLKKVDSLKQNFISLMSHDLKTPVAKIAGITDILQTQFQNTGRQGELLQNINIATVELNNFISSILDLTKIESREIRLNLESKDITTIVENVVSQLKFEANSQQIDIGVQLEPLYPIKVDSKLVHRVISNLVGNAIKYSGPGSRVEIKAWDDEKWVYIEVADNGVGIPEEDLEHIFDKFYRVKNDDSHKIKGSGLGLYLVKYFIELHEGKILVSSRLGEGTSFTIQLKNE